MFGTSDFTGSPAESPEYIDATAEETCPAESAPMSEPDKGPQRPAGQPDEAASVATLEVKDQLKDHAQNVTQGNQASPDQGNASSFQGNKSEGASPGDPGASPAMEPSISVFPRPTGFENKPTIDDRPKFGNRAFAVAGFVVAALIGAGGTFAWQAHLQTNNAANDATTAAVPVPVAAAPTIPPYLGRQLEELAQDISSVRRGMEELAAKQQELAGAQQQLEQLAVKQKQLAAKQDQVGQSLAKLQALEQARQRTPAPVQTRAAPVPPRPSVPPPAPAEPAMQPPPPPPPPRTAEHPVPPLPVPSQ
jgi:hypothetical protein